MLNQIVDFLDRSTPRGVKAWAKRCLPGVDRSAYRLVQRWSASGSSTVRIKAGVLKGRLFICALKWERNYWLGIHEPALMDFAARTIRPGDVVYDIGGHKGYFALAAAVHASPAGRVVVFEPNPSNHADIMRNVRLSPDLEERIEVVQMALADKKGSETFVGGANASVGHLARVHDEDADARYQVDTTTLDEFVASRQPPRVIKMDIEGAERWALLGMVRVLKEHSPVLVVEIHDQESAASLNQLASLAGYTLSTIDGRRLSAELVYATRDHVVARPAS